MVKEVGDITNKGMAKLFTVEVLLAVMAGLITVTLTYAAMASDINMLKVRQQAQEQRQQATDLKQAKLVETVNRIELHLVALSTRQEDTTNNLLRIIEMLKTKEER